MCEHLIPNHLLSVLKQLEPSDLWAYSQAQKRPDFYQQYGIEILGIGTESFVFVHPSDQTKAVAIKYHDRAVSNTKVELPLTRIQAERIRCLHAIFGTIFPDNIPPLLHVQGRDPEDPPQPTGTIRQRIIPANPETTATAPTHPFRWVYSECIRWGIPLAFDRNAGNFLLGSDGREWYCDLIAHDDLSPYADPYYLGQANKSIRRYMDDRQLPKAEKTVVNQAVEDLYEVLF